MMKKNSRLGTSLLVVLIVLIGLLSAGELWVKHRVQSEASKQLTMQLKADKPVNVKINDTPFLGSIVRNRIASGTVNGENIVLSTANASSLEVRRFDVSFTNLSPAREPRKGVIEKASGNALVEWQALSKVSGTTITYGGDNRIAANITLSFFGRSAEAELSGVPNLERSTGKIKLTEARAKIAGIELPSSLVNVTINRLTDGLAFPMVEGLFYESIEVFPEGVGVRLSAANVDLSKVW